jgi:Fungal Zn(2)-Cys(6) binuclear cluster domain
MPKTSKFSTQNTVVKGPLAPDVVAQSRKTSSSSGLDLQQPSKGDEEDLSSKPRCQRCRKSKKGCDRQRPCQRCKDAGIGIEGCVSEDEGNGRKGRFGRHMGVPLAIKENDRPLIDDDSQAGAILNGMAAVDAADKNKKRKR